VVNQPHILGLSDTDLRPGGFGYICCSRTEPRPHVPDFLFPKIQFVWWPQIEITGFCWKGCSRTCVHEVLINLLV